MKKVLTAITTSPLFFTLVTSASYAQEIDSDLNPCSRADRSDILNAACAGQGLSIGAVVGFVITIAFIIAVLIALFFLVWGGIKWITSGGDKGGVEGARNQIIAAVIGLIIVFLAFFILNLVLNLFGLNLFDLELPNFQDLR